MTDVSWIKEEIGMVDQMILDRLMPEQGFPVKVIKAMNYSVKAGGKRLRPLLMWESFKAFGGKDTELIAAFMTAMEAIHTYSLVHDDLPALDGDELRRGKPSTWKQYGEAEAILAGDGLLHFAFEKMLSVADRVAAAKVKAYHRALSTMAELSGMNGMLGGQAVDVVLTGTPLDEETLRYIYEKKTGALIAAPLIVGAVLAGAPEPDVLRMRKAGEALGMAFQIQDDILDITGTEEELGKPLHSDEKNAKTTWVSLYGLTKAGEDAGAYLRKTKEAFQEMSVPTERLGQLCDWLLDRKN